MSGVMNLKLPVYKYDELAEDARDQAVNEMFDLNVDYDWWDSTLDFTREEWEQKYGLTFDWKKVYFDLGRGRYLYFGGINIEDSAKLLRAVSGNTAYGTMAARGILEPYFETVHYGGGCGATYLHLLDNRSEAARELPFDTEAWFKNLTEELWSTLSKEYEYLTGREAVEETIRINEYDFFEDGHRVRKIVAAS